MQSRVPAAEEREHVRQAQPWPMATRRARAARDLPVPEVVPVPLKREERIPCVPDDCPVEVARHCAEPQAQGRILRHWTLGGGVGQGFERVALVGPHARAQVDRHARLAPAEPAAGRGGLLGLRAVKSFVRSMSRPAQAQVKNPLGQQQGSDEPIPVDIGRARFLALGRRLERGPATGLNTTVSGVKRLPVAYLRGYWAASA